MTAEDKTAFHPQVIAMGNGAWGALHRIISYTRQYSTDGFIDYATMGIIASTSELRSLLHGRPTGYTPFLTQSDGGYRLTNWPRTHQLVALAGVQ